MVGGRAEAAERITAFDTTLFESLAAGLGLGPGPGESTEVRLTVPVRDPDRNGRP